MKYLVRFTIGAIIGFFAARADAHYSMGDTKYGRVYMILSIVCAFVGFIVYMAVA